MVAATKAVDLMARSGLQGMGFVGVVASLEVAEETALLETVA